MFVLLFAHKIINIIRLCLTYTLPARADFAKFADGGFVSDLEFFRPTSLISYDISYSNKALITGGAGGIGKQTAIEFAKLGIDLYLMDYNGTMLDKTVKEIKTAYPGIQVRNKGRINFLDLDESHLLRF